MSEFLTHWNNVEKLKADAEVIQYFGLGFVQVKLSPTERIHYYHPDLQATVNSESAHTHRYSFTSQILKGMLLQRLFIANYEQRTHIETFEDCKPDTPGFDEDSFQHWVWLIEIANFASERGSSYWLHMDNIHAVSAVGKTVTHLTRPAVATAPLALVYTPIDSPKVCPFVSDLTENDLWDIVADTIDS